MAFINRFISLGLLWDASPFIVVKYCFATLLMKSVIRFTVFQLSRSHVASHFTHFKGCLSNVSWTSLGPLLKSNFCYFSRSSALFKSQLLTLIRIVSILTLVFIIPRKCGKLNCLTRDTFE